MNKPAIESGVPVKVYAYTKYPFPSMDKGDSFLWVGNERLVRSAAANYRKRHKGFNFTTRKVDGGVRVWRI